MNFSVTPIRTPQACVPAFSSALPVSALYEVVGDYWTFVVTFQDTGLAAVAGAGGTGYTVAPLVSVAAPTPVNGRTALVHAIVANGSVSYVVDDPGSGYDFRNPPVVTITGGNGTGAAAAARVGNPINLTGQTVGAEILPGYNGQPLPCTIVSVANNVVTFGFGGSSSLVPQGLSATVFPVRLHAFVTDSFGHRTTYLVQPIVPVSANSADLAILPPSPALVAVGGPAGPQGDPGIRADQAQIIATVDAEIAAQFATLKGDPGDSAYQLALKNGFVGTQAQWLVSLKGDAGASGTQGPKGDPGQQGLPGNQGPKGDTGTQGNAGPQGQQGTQGVPGPQGQAGPQGQSGLQGSQGQQGIPGVKGDPGTKGDTGATGQQGAQGLPGPQGDPGQVGFILGSDVPSSLIGTDGQGYLRTTDKSFYYRSAGVWNLLGYLSSTSDGGAVADNTGVLSTDLSEPGSFWLH